MSEEIKPKNSMKAETFVLYIKCCHKDNSLLL